jgi:hypothetical protein
LSGEGLIIALCALEIVAAGAALAMFVVAMWR